MAAALAAAMALLLAPLASGAARDDAVLAAGRTLSGQFEAGKLAELLARMTPAARDALGGADGLAELRERVLREDGPESGLIAEETRTAGTLRIYRRIARRNVGDTPTLMEWTLDAQDRVVELAVRPQPMAMPSGKGNY